MNGKIIVPIILAIIIGGIMRPSFDELIPPARGVPLMQPDKDAWPGDALSEDQVKSAISKYLEDYAEEPSKWHWVLIGPGDYLLAGTHYRVVDRRTAPYPNISIVKGYWGGDSLFTESIASVQTMAKTRALDDYGSGRTP